MSGKEVKDRLAAIGIKQIELARMLKVPQPNISGMFNSKDVKSGMLERIAAAIGKDMRFFYPELAQPCSNSVHNSGVISTSAGDADICYNSDKVIEMLNDQLKTKDDQLLARDKQIADLIQIIGNK